MKLRIKNFILVTILAFVTIGGTTSCGSKKKLAKKEYEAKVAQAKADLNAIIELNSNLGFAAVTERATANNIIIEITFFILIYFFTKIR